MNRNKVGRVRFRVAILVILFLRDIFNTLVDDMVMQPDLTKVDIRTNNLALHQDAILDLFNSSGLLFLHVLDFLLEIENLLVLSGAICFRFLQLGFELLYPLVLGLNLLLQLLDLERRILLGFFQGHLLLSEEGYTLLQLLGQNPGRYHQLRVLA